MRLFVGESARFRDRLLDDDIEVGKRIEVTPDYFEKAYYCIFEIGVKLAHVLWRKHQPEDLENAD